MSEQQVQPQISTGRLYRASPDIWRLLSPRKGLLACGLVLMSINRVACLVLPASTKWLIDDVVNKRRADLLWPLVSIVLFATVIQGLTHFALLQSLPKEG